MVPESPGNPRKQNTIPQASRDRAHRRPEAGLRNKKTLPLLRMAGNDVQACYCQQDFKLKMY